MAELQNDQTEQVQIKSLDRRERFLNWSRMIFYRNRSYTFIDIFIFLGNLLVVYFVAFVTLLVGRLISLQPGQTIDKIQWIILSVTPFILAVLSYIREQMVTRNTDRRAKFGSAIYSSITGAVERLIEVIDKPKDGNKIGECASRMLTYIENGVRDLLRSEGVLLSGDISANLMVKSTKKDELYLKYFGATLENRKKITLPINKEKPLPGASAAYVNNQMIYIDDIKKYGDAFRSDAPYRSIISIPIMGRDNKKIFGILNIDSTTPNQFVSTDYISKRISPILSPLIALLRLQIFLLPSIK